ncbi:MAG: polyhydroxyalkanoate synthesis repressor PhaR [Steroidobacteraceae bacterium]
MSDPRIIKKYPNRRLYDTVESRYITLADVRKLVVERIDFMVVDKKTQQDITRAILLQVIADQENGADPIMSRDFLSQIIRSYGANMPGLLGSYLEQSVKLFASQQRDLRDRVRNVVGIDPIDTVAGVAQRNYQRWRAAQDEILQTLANASSSGTRSSSEEKSTEQSGSTPPN